LFINDKMKFSIINIKGDKVSDITADKNIFAIKPNNGVVRQAILSELNNMRQGTHSSKNRALVKGGGKKPWKQKGRGVARAGTIRSPLWRGGGTVFGPEPHTYSHKLPKKLSKLARKSVLSAKALNDEIIILEDYNLDSHKTSQFVAILKILKLDNKKLTILYSGSEVDKLEMAARNLHNVSLVDSKKASAYDLIDCEVLVIDKNSIKDLEHTLRD
tara:strand:+ start:274 stop:921 length:648 start_codon:yes stop_codon:yes gene_type:complete